MRAIRTTLIIVAVILLAGVVLGAGAFAYLNSQNAAQPVAVVAMESDESVQVSQTDGEDWIVFRPLNQEPTTGFIIYPGGFVDPVAYAPVARDIASRGFLVVIDPMPLNLAVLGLQGADDIIAAFPEITTWAIGGHSLGGAMAAEYINRNPDSIDGLALWAAYPAENTDLIGASIEAVSLYGDADGVASIDDVLDGATRLPAGSAVILLPGANHTQFGRYGTGLQRGDNPAGITPDEQQRLVVERTAELLGQLNN